AWLPAKRSRIKNVTGWFAYTLPLTSDLPNQEKDANGVPRAVGRSYLHTICSVENM
ncbi:hypothetical protein SK128_011408, partial [Halocaridina rubra]